MYALIFVQFFLLRLFITVSSKALIKSRTDFENFLFITILSGENKEIRYSDFYFVQYPLNSYQFSTLNFVFMDQRKQKTRKAIHTFTSLRIVLSSIILFKNSKTVILS